MPAPTMRGLASLTRPERLKLLEFVCAAMWADLDVSHWEKSHILGLALRLGLPDGEKEQVREWLEKPPPPEDVDPAQIPAEHRRLFLKAMEEAVAADLVVDAPEREMLRLFRELLQ
jgi:uncharacterized membrane protein YebE (DUF533 family)